MHKANEIRQLLIKNFTLDRKSKSMLMSTVLYVFSTVFICYLTFANLENQHWNSLFWIIALFAVTNAGNKIFINESNQMRTYLYTLASPQSIILSKLIYQCLLSSALALVVWICMMTVFSTDLKHPMYFLAGILLGIWAISNVLTLNNALSSSTSNGPTLLAILSFPVLLPVLMSTIKASKLSMMTVVPADYYSMLLVLGLLNLLTATLAYLLFPYLWRY